MKGKRAILNKGEKKKVSGSKKSHATFAAWVGERDQQLAPQGKEGKGHNIRSDVKERGEIACSSPKKKASEKIHRTAPSTSPKGDREGRFGKERKELRACFSAVHL